MIRVALLLFSILTISLLAKDRTVPVFILAGQSNMEGHGRIAGPQKGTLETLSADPATAGRYRHLRRNGSWITREDVWITWLDRKGKLGVGGWAAKGAIGPELGFGWVVGDFLETPTLLLKFGPGGTSLAGPWRPPSAGAHRNGKARGDGIGTQYDNLITNVKSLLVAKRAKTKRVMVAAYCHDHNYWNALICATIARQLGFRRESSHYHQHL